MKGTNSAFNQIPDSAYPQFAHDYYNAVNPPAPIPVSAPYPYYVVPYPATFRPFTPPGYIFSPTFDQSVATGVSNLENARPLDSPRSGDVIWGYSQGATVVTQYKRDFNSSDPSVNAPTFVLVANPNRPNGGILERGVALGTIPILGLTFSGATPTTTSGPSAGSLTTYDIARQYDGIADAPENPLNPVADLNAMMGFYYLHGQYPNADLTTAIDQGRYGDTEYFLIPTYPLPLLMPLDSIPVIGFPLADTLDPPLRVIVESAYDRSTSPGEPTPFNPLYVPNPATFGTNLLVAIPTGLDNGISDFTGTRPFGTIRPGPYGVGGPPTPQLSTPTQGTSPTIPVLFGSPSGGMFALLNPANLSQSLTPPDGSQPSISSFSNTTNELTNLGPDGQNPPAGSQLQANSPNGTVFGQRLAPVAPPNESREPEVADTAGQSNDDQSAATKPRPRLNVLRSSPGAPVPQPGTSSPNGSRSANNPIGSVTTGISNSLAGAADSIRSALGGTSKNPKGGAN